MHNKKSKASVLVVTLMVLGILLITGLSISLVSVQERKASLSSNTSSLAYQSANSGIEAVMSAISTAPNSNASVSSLSFPAQSNVSCSGGTISGPNFQVALMGSDGSVIACNDGSKKISDVVNIKSTGTGSNQDQRAIQAAVAATPSIETVSFWANGSDHGGGGNNIDCNWYAVSTKAHWSNGSTTFDSNVFCSLTGIDSDDPEPESSATQAQVCASHNDGLNTAQCQIRYNQASGQWEYGAPIGSNWRGCGFTCFRFK